MEKEKDLKTTAPEPLDIHITLPEGHCVTPGRWANTDTIVALTPTAAKHLHKHLGDILWGTEEAADSSTPPEQPPPAGPLGPPDH